MNRPLTIFLAGDSTVQSYNEANAPQAGWGQALIRHLSDGAWSVHPSHSSHFESSTTYEHRACALTTAPLPGAVRRAIWRRAGWRICLRIFRRATSC
ncbi:MAG: hypothetical protein IJT34_11955 [Butyrivibrio sp.]|nr:hypothetical protein [Butyrivibrio sp.]